MPKKLMKCLCERIKMVEMKKDEFVFYEGDRGKRFYVIIEGEVNLIEEIKTNN